MAKTATQTTTPPFFDPSGHARDPQGIGASIRLARTTNGIEPKVMAKMLRIPVKDLEAIESGEVIPDDGVVLRISDVLDCPLEPLSKALDYTKEKVREAEERRLAALELGRKTQEAENRKRAEAEAAKEKKAQDQATTAVKPPTMRTASDTPKRTLEDFGERLMDVSPVPVDATRRKQWWTCARILFDLEGQ
jgi:ribosome-binding protein aMBF1 (putative translation factor)